LCVDAAKAVAHTFVEEEKGMEPSKFMTCGAGGASVGKPKLSRSVVEFKEKIGWGSWPMAAVSMP
jgi:hypothetical protein